MTYKDRLCLRYAVQFLSRGKALFLNKFVLEKRGQHPVFFSFCPGMLLDGDEHVGEIFCARKISAVHEYARGDHVHMGVYESRQYGFIAKIQDLGPVKSGRLFSGPGKNHLAVAYAHGLDSGSGFIHRIYVAVD